MIYIHGRCQRCGKYYELPRQEQEASAYLSVNDNGTVVAAIICNSVIMCDQRAAERSDNA